ncbi:MAG TPA: hypothetical protein VM577_07535, partial [Anaerovoracaceae bacterium]|nr:hypothetical protein [Anaerovoracaceae bacterium]
FRELQTSDKNIWVVAPTYELSTRVWDNVEFWARKFPSSLKPRKLDPIKGRSIENLATGSVLRIKSADNPKQLKGDAGDLVIIEEAGDMDEDVWPKYLEPFISQTRSNGKQGNAVFIGNAAHQGHWFHRKWLEPNDEQNQSLWIPTALEDSEGNIVSSNNPNIIGVSELQRIKAGNSKRTWEQEWLAKWLAGSGQVFRNINICIGNSLKPAIPGHYYVLGLDLAKLQDWTVLTVIDLNTFEVVFLDRFNQIDWPLQKLRVMETARNYNNAQIHLDATGIGDPLFDDLQRMGLNVEGYKLNNSSKKALIEKLSIYIEQGKIKYPADPQLMRELEIYGYEQTKSGNTTFNAPSGDHDDMVVSLALAVWKLPESKSLMPEEGIYTQEEKYSSDSY